MPPVRGRLQHLVVGLAVSALARAFGRSEAEVLGHHSGLVRRVELVRPDLERVADAAGTPERPVLGRSGGVVQPVARDVGVVVVARHPRAELLQERLLERRTRVGHAGRAQHEVRVGVVGDQVRDHPLRLQPADVLGLRLGERPRAPERVRDTGSCWLRCRPRSRRSCGSGPRPVDARSSGLLSHVLSGNPDRASSSCASSRTRRRSNSVSGGKSGASREMLKPSGFTIGTTMLRVARTSRVVRPELP